MESIPATPFGADFLEDVETGGYGCHCGDRTTNIRPPAWDKNDF